MIASVLLILLVLVIAALIFLWARGFLSEQIEKFGTPIENYCEKIDFDVSLINELGMDKLEVVNRGNIDLFNFEIKKIKGGNSEAAKFKFSVDAGKAVTKEINLEMEDGSGPDEIIVYPVLIGNVAGKSSNKPLTCLEQGITIKHE